MTETTFIGVDLAWRSDRNPSGAAVLRGSRSGACLSVVEFALRSQTDVLAFIRHHTSARTIVAVDAPLIIGNVGGQRTCETLVGVRYGGRHASCHTSNLTLYPNASSVSLGDELARAEFVHAPISFDQNSRVLLEVYPHAAMVALFDLPTIIKYKKGPVAQRRMGLRELRSRLAALSTATPALDRNDRLEQLLHTDVDRLAGDALKSYEDGLDAVFCAYLGYHYWYWRGERTEVFGDVQSGYILNPMLVS